MTDIVDKKTRSRMMSGIQGKDTKPELIIRRGLHRMGFRYRLHHSSLPGKPDMVFPKFGAVILVNGCFWHQHDCHMFKWPKTRREFWRKKITGNRARDIRNLEIYEKLGWKVLIVWECAVKGKARKPTSEVIQKTANWLQFESLSSEIKGVSLS